MHKRALSLSICAAVAAIGLIGSSSAADQAAAPKAAEASADLSQIQNIVVIYAENRGFDHLFGHFPGANGLFTAPEGERPARRTRSFVQQYLDTSLNVAKISPFLMPQAVTTASGTVVPIYPADEISVDHSHQGRGVRRHPIAAMQYAQGQQRRASHARLVRSSATPDR